MQFTTLLALAPLALASPLNILSRQANSCTDPSGNPQDEWFITPSQGTDCNTDLPNYRPNPGPASTGASCQPLYNLEADPNGATTFTSASVTTPCGGWNVTLYGAADCSDQGVTISGTNAAPACVQPPSGSSFTAFAVVAA